MEKTPVRSTTHLKVATDTFKPYSTKDISNDLMCKTPPPKRNSERVPANKTTTPMKLYTKGVDPNTNEWRIDHYKFKELLGKGSFSLVYRAMNIKDGRDYAIKIVNEERIEKQKMNHLEEDPDEKIEQEDFVTVESMWESIVDEGKILSSLSGNDNIVRFYGIFEKGFYVKKDGRIDMKACYSVSEICPNGDLWEYIEYSGRFYEKYCRYMFKQIINALDYMHQKGIYHRDIKPHNMLLNEEFEIKITDFGFSTTKEGAQETIQGTPEYEAPELINEHTYDGAKVDIFAAGVSQFNQYTGKPAFKVANKKFGSDEQYSLIAKKSPEYWKKISEKYWCVKDPDSLGLFSKDFKTQIFGLQHLDPEKRQSIEEIKRHPWMVNGEECTGEEMKKEFMKRIGPMKYTKNQKKIQAMREKEFKPFNYRKRKISKQTNSSTSSPFKVMD